MSLRKTLLSFPLTARANRKNISKARNTKSGSATEMRRIRQANQALHSNDSLHFHAIDNPHLICYSKSTPGFENTILVVVNLDSFNEQTGWTNLGLDRLGIGVNESFLVEDLLNGASYAWKDRNYVALRPGVQPAHIFRVSRLQ